MQQPQHGIAAFEVRTDAAHHHEPRRDRRARDVHRPQVDDDPIQRGPGLFNRLEPAHVERPSDVAVEHRLVEVIGVERRKLRSLDFGELGIG